MFRCVIIGVIVRVYSRRFRVFRSRYRLYQVETRCSSHSEAQNLEVLLVHCLMILGDDSCQNKRMTSLFGIFNVERKVSPRKANTIGHYLVMIRKMFPVDDVFVLLMSCLK